MVFGNNNTSDIIKIVQNTTSRKAVSGIWKILKYYEPVLLPNTTYRSHYSLFIIEAKEFLVMHEIPLFLWLKKQTQVSTFATIFSGQ